MRTKQKLPSSGFMRLPQILEIIPIGKSTLWSWVKEDKFPKPVKLSERVTAWKVEDVEAIIISLGGNDAE